MSQSSDRATVDGHPGVSRVSYRPSRASRLKLAGLLSCVVALLVGALTAAPASARPNCDVPSPPPVCDLESPESPLPPKSGSPSGSIDSVARTPDGIKVTGSANDPDASGPINIQFWIDGAASSSLQTVDGAFNGTLPARAGRLSICATATNRNQGEDAHLGCRTIVVRLNPLGSIDRAEGLAESIVVGGWAIDPDASTPIAVHVYVDDDSGRAVTANVTYSVIADYFPLYGPNHAFTAIIPASRGTHTVCVYAINTGPGEIDGSGDSNTDLGCHSVFVGPSLPYDKVNLIGQFTYIDDVRWPGQAEYQRPIADAKVDIWAFAPGVFGIWTWSFLGTTATDNSGNLLYSSSVTTPGAVYAVRLFATNDAAVVFPHTVADPGGPYWTEPGSPGAPIQLTARGKGDVLDFSYAFEDRGRGKFFNIAETLRWGLAFAEARRADSDPIPAVSVQPDALITFYNEPVHELDLTAASTYQDLSVLHEYAHYLEDMIGSFIPLPSHHNGCEATIGGILVNSPQHAWMEAFAEWFAQAVNLRTPQANFVGTSGTSSVDALESPACPVLPMGMTGSSVENFVAGVLWDVTDATTIESFDTLADFDTEVFQIMDGPLDESVLGLPAPTIDLFRKAWNSRDLPQPGLGLILRGNGVPAT